MSAPVIAVQRPTRTSSPFIAIAVAAVFVLAAAIGLFAVAVWSPATTDGGAVVENQYADGYPLHGGLAGPSRISTFEHPGYGAMYPLHHGLAGPSRVGTADQSGFAAGYPVNGGLAGPSRVATVERSGFGPGYPLHGGLAGSQADEGR